MTKGIKTTEFWAMLVGLGGLGWTFIQQNCEVDSVKIVAFGGVLGTYILGRSWVKSQQ